MHSLRAYIQSQPLSAILITAAFWRLMAAIFSYGFGMTDDHAHVIEVAQRWVDGYRDWFDHPTAANHSIVYPGLHYLLFSVLDSIGVSHPTPKMFIVRLLHAAYSLLIVWYGYRIANRLAGAQAARWTGWLLALLWLMPILSVRNLVEVVCIVPCMAAFYQLIRHEHPLMKDILIAGLLLGLAFAFRYQVMLFTAGIGLAFLLQRQVKFMLMTGVSFIIGAFLVQGVTDWISWGYPFASFYQNVTYNMAKQNAYVSGNWAKYILFLFGVLIPPISVFIYYGWLRHLRKWLLISLPLLIFLLFHTYFPNRQERFILPMLPLMTAVGIAGWVTFMEHSSWWPTKDRLMRRSWVAFYILNAFLLILFSFSSTKSARINALLVLREIPESNPLVWEQRKKAGNLPAFYLGRDPSTVILYRTQKTHTVAIERVKKERPKFISMMGMRDIDQRIESFTTRFNAKLTLFRVIEPSLIDQLLHILNPKYNRSRKIHIYKIQYDDASG